MFSQNLNAKHSKSSSKFGNVRSMATRYVLRHVPPLGMRIVAVEENDVPLLSRASSALLRFTSKYRRSLIFVAASSAGLAIASYADPRAELHIREAYQSIPRFFNAYSLSIRMLCDYWYELRTITPETPPKERAKRYKALHRVWAPEVATFARESGGILGLAIVKLAAAHRHVLPQEFHILSRIAPENEPFSRELLESLHRNERAQLISPESEAKVPSLSHEFIRIASRPSPNGSSSSSSFAGLGSPSHVYRAILRSNDSDDSPKVVLLRVPSFGNTRAYLDGLIVDACLSTASTLSSLFALLSSTQNTSTVSSLQSMWKSSFSGRSIDALLDQRIASLAAEEAEEMMSNVPNLKISPFSFSASLANYEKRIVIPQQLAPPSKSFLILEDLSNPEQGGTPLYALGDRRGIRKELRSSQSALASYVSNAVTYCAFRYAHAPVYTSWAALRYQRSTRACLTDFFPISFSERDANRLYANLENRTLDSAGDSQQLLPLNHSSSSSPRSSNAWLWLLIELQDQKSLVDWISTNVSDEGKKLFGSLLSDENTPQPQIPNADASSSSSASAVAVPESMEEKEAALRMAMLSPHFFEGLWRFRPYSVPMAMPDSIESLVQMNLYLRHLYRALDQPRQSLDVLHKSSLSSLSSQITSMSDRFACLWLRFRIRLSMAAYTVDAHWVGGLRDLIRWAFSKSGLARILEKRSYYYAMY